MAYLIFVCPSTGRAVDSGVESEIGTLLRIRQQSVRVLCPACAGWHQWAVRDAFLAKAAGDLQGAPIVTSPDSCHGCAAPWRP